MYLSQQNFSSVLNTNVIYGVNSVEKSLAGKIKEFKKLSVFIAADPGLVQAGIPTKIQNLLKENGIHSVLFSEIEPNPDAETVMKGAEIYQSESCDMILAVGGGSAMDFSKAVGVMASHPGHILDYRRGQKPVVNEVPLLFAIPTTVGTGSEVTNVAVVTDHKAGRKYVVASPVLAPKMAFVDPILTTSLPRHVVATTGMDALVHAIEAYTSVRSTPITDGLALQVIKMIKDYLPASYAHSDQLEARSQVHLASTIAGMAFGLAGVGLVHSCSHPMSAIYHVPHGLANAILLPYVMQYNLIANERKYAEIARIFDPSLTFETDRAAAEQLINVLKDFNQVLNIPNDFGFLNKQFTEEMVDRLADDAMDDRGTIPNNPRKVFKEDVVQIFNQVLPINQQGGSAE
ncbi:iron-containing alcohol dehydrogenase family protein [Mesobacillus maritimus]|uniref:iron-containing alcohol dehydrogenase family protein n=1 Tax=Mesobacillus maritimus TaxID=1643336 RepID=UPI00203EE26D|nr:iron-containing alcohol dehydrogenase family protein [Mesobacillus maritimus]MCM3588382.1 iron-containing alcohol dehydrogenase family protein [Mesobacillus maritimus]